MITKEKPMAKKGELPDAYKRLKVLNAPTYLEDEKGQARKEIREFWAQRLNGEKSPKLLENKNCWNEDFSSIKLDLPRMYNDDAQVYRPSEAALRLFALLTENEFCVSYHLVGYNFKCLSEGRIPGRVENEREMLVKILHPDTLAKLSSSLDGSQIRELFGEIDYRGGLMGRNNGERKRLIEKLASSLNGDKIRELAEFAAVCNPFSLIHKLSSQGGEVAQKLAAQIVEKLAMIEKDLRSFLDSMLKRDGNQQDSSSA